ncbi:glycosyltransferase [Microbacterium sp. STN6]|uniref:glycosyltransferase n=1 Tax=Microbacterium sp. STN6 TaxID=2995588 RepID=UPI002260949C|nr:glycosyltransferase [Microbacterium sp. STN6]MCX7521026.1 glycosyltransferase [Microbacterium sp. STN6]
MTSLSIQTILYENSPQDILRSVCALAHAAQLAKDARSVNDWEIAVGDSSPEPVFAEGLLAQLREIVEAAGGSFRYQFFGANLGHGGGHNVVASQGKSDVLVFVNPDGVVAPDALARLMAALGPGVGAVDARQLPIEHPKEFNSRTGETAWASGACLATAREVFDSVGGFDDDTFFMYCDDVDYSWRVKLAGFAVLHQPSARLFHDKRLSSGATYLPGDAEVYYSAEAALLLAHKYSRQDVVDRIISAFQASASPVEVKVLAEFERRRAEHRLPAQIDPGHDVGQFTSGNYAPHRY